ncbi:hypothetical protein [Embleya sp. NPDC059237]|uniref:hypothetical protein n=1 Tax=Embleya sp. NPDC059237 TaxID=3346784 RepID=UPI0036784694
MTMGVPLLLVSLGMVVLECTPILSATAARIVRWSARRLPGEGNAERFEEEWLAGLGERRLG